MSIGDKTLNVLNIYTMTADDPDFFREIQSRVSAFAYDELFLMGGDFNTVIDPCLDRRSSACFSFQRSHKVLASLIQSHSLMDQWRLLQLQERNYTFFSHPHHSYSRLDLFLYSKYLIGDLLGADIRQITLSDYAPVLITFQFLPK